MVVWTRQSLVWEYGVEKNLSQSLFALSVGNVALNFLLIYVALWHFRSVLYDRTIVGNRTDKKDEHRYRLISTAYPH